MWVQILLNERCPDSDVKVLKVSESKGTTFDEFSLVVDALDNTTGGALMKVIGDSICPVG